MTTLLSQAYYKMYEKSIYSGGEFSYNTLKEVSKVMDNIVIQSKCKKQTMFYFIINIVYKNFLF